MAKKSFSFRIDDDNMRFIDSLKNHGDAPAMIVNHAIRMFQRNIKMYANMAHLISPATLFEDMEKFKIGDEVVITSSMAKHYNINGHIGKVEKVYSSASGRSYNVKLTDGRKVTLNAKCISHHESVLQQ